MAPPLGELVERFPGLKKPLRCGVPVTAFKARTRRTPS